MNRHYSTRLLGKDRLSPILLITCCFQRCGQYLVRGPGAGGGNETQKGFCSSGTDNFRSMLMDVAAGIIKIFNYV